MRALVWIVEDTWEATVAEAAAFLPADAEVTLLHVAPGDVETLAEGSRHGLLGRRRHRRPTGAARAAARHLRRGRRRRCWPRRATAWGARRAPSAAAGASATRSPRRPRAWTCSCSRATATIRGWVPAASGPARASPSTTPRAGCCWCGPTRRRGVDTIPPPPITDDAERPRDAARGPRRLRARARARGRRRRLRHPLRALLHRAARSARRRLRRRSALRARSGPRCSTAIARTAAERAHALRTLDHEREITQDWLQREQAVGYVTYVDRFAGHVARAARAPALPARAGDQLPAPHAAAALAARAQRRRVRGRRLRRGRAGAGHDGRPARAGRRAARAREWRCASTSCSTTPRASTRGRRPRWPATSGRWPSTGRSRTAPSPTPTS